MTLGRICMLVGFALAIYAAAAALMGTRGDQRLVVSARRAMYAMAGVLTTAVLVLEVAYLRSDFSFSLVVLNSSTTTPTFYKMTALWSSQGGSLLLWSWLLALYSSAVLFVTRARHREVAPWANAVLAAVGAFFIGLMVFIPEANPFLASAGNPVEGNGLNPLLRHPSMVIHPPMLYAGYVGFSVPFAFAIGALITRRLDAGWIRSTRRYTLLAWLFLGTGIMLGARWSYAELGWGGYWGWDPVENASLIPWLTGTAFLHSIMVQEKRGMLKVWNVGLIIATFCFALLGTFLVRSGILESIHAFGASTLGVPFVIFIAFVVFSSAALVVSRLPDLRSKHRLDSLLSREAFFLVNNFLLVALAVTILWGTFFPLISEALTGTKASVGPPWFNQYIGPIAIALVLMMGLGPAVPWRKMSPSRLVHAFRFPTVVAAVVTVSLLLATGVADSLRATLLFAFAALSIAVVVQEFYRGTRARQSIEGGRLLGALGGLVTRNRRRYGGYIVHVGIIVLMVGVAASAAFGESSERKLKQGEAITVGDYQVRYVRPVSRVSSEKLSFGVILDVSQAGKHVTTLRTERSYFPAATDAGPMGWVGRYFSGEATTEVGMKAGLTRDIWSAVAPDLTQLKPLIREARRKFPDAKPDVQAVIITAIVDAYERRAGSPTVRVLVNPMVTWIWVGGLLAFAGAIFALWPAAASRRRRISGLAAARLAGSGAGG